MGAPTSAADAVPKDLMVFLLLGQSNMAGRGPIGPEDKVADPRVFVLNRDQQWVPAIDPLHFDKPDIVGAGLGRSFARAVADANPGRAIGLVPAAVGGSSLDEWKPGSSHYSNAVARARAALKRGELAGILWHQGESDTSPARTRTYNERFVAFIARLRADLGAENVPVIVGELGRFKPEHAAMNAELAKLPQLVPHCGFVSSEGLTDKGDHLHFATPSLHTFGARYAEAWLKVRGGASERPKSARRRATDFSSVPETAGRAGARTGHLA
jgi:hypothetical protein